MGSKAKKNVKKQEFDLFDDLDDFYDDDLEFQDLNRRISGRQWEDIFDADVQMTARRQIERKRDFMKLRSDLDEWEQFGESASW